MKKIIVLALTLTILLTTFAFASIVAADENAEHICILTGYFLAPGGSMTSRVYDVNGNLVNEYTVTNDTSAALDATRIVYVPAVSGTEVVTYTSSSVGTVDIRFIVNDWFRGNCFADGRLNSRPDRDLAAPVAIYLRFAERGDGFDGYDVYDINQFAGTGALSIRVTADELNAAADEVVASGANVTVAQEGDVIFTVLAISTADEAICQVNATDSEGKSYEYQWTCLG